MFTLPLLALAVASSASSLSSVEARLPVGSSQNRKNFMEEHFEKEHHIGTFDLASFFAVHDLNRDGILDVSGRE